MESKRSVILFIAMSLDGYITGPNEDLGFLSMVEKEGEDYGYSEFVKTVDTVIIGRKTYDKVVSIGHQYPQTVKEAYIITRSERPPVENFQYYRGSPKDLVAKLRSQEGKNIYCDGGAEIIHELLLHRLIDEVIVSVIPVLLGEGISLFKGGRPQQNMKLVTSKQFDTGLVQLHYKMDGK